MQFTLDLVTHVSSLGFGRETSNNECELFSDYFGDIN